MHASNATQKCHNESTSAAVVLQSTEETARSACIMIALWHLWPRAAAYDDCLLSRIQHNLLSCTDASCFTRTPSGPAQGYRNCAHDVQACCEESLCGGRCGATGTSPGCWGQPRHSQKPTAHRCGGVGSVCVKPCASWNSVDEGGGRCLAARRRSTSSGTSVALYRLKVWLVSQ